MWANISETCSKAGPGEVTLRKNAGWRNIIRYRSKTGLKTAPEGKTSRFKDVGTSEERERAYSKSRGRRYSARDQSPLRVGDRQGGGGRRHGPPLCRAAQGKAAVSADDSADAAGTHSSWRQTCQDKLFTEFQRAFLSSEVNQTRKMQSCRTDAGAERWRTAAPF